MQFNYQNPYPTTRLPVFARNVVSTSHPLAAQAGLRMLWKGGNAVDAAIAAAAAITLCEPVSNGLGSDSFAILWDGQQLHGLNASGCAPQGWTPEYFRLKYGQAIPKSAKLIGVNLSASTLRKNRIPDTAIWRPMNRWVYEIIRRVTDARRDPDPVTVLAYGRQHAATQSLDPTRPPTAGQHHRLALHLADLYTHTVSAAAAANHARDVLDEAYRRAVREHGIRMQQMADSGAERADLTDHFTTVRDELGHGKANRFSGMKVRLNHVQTASRRGARCWMGAFIRHLVLPMAAPPVDIVLMRHEH